MTTTDTGISSQAHYQVNELFTSIQGEGILTGTFASFIRLQGCPVGCVWCDSGPLADLDIHKRSTNGETRNTWGKGGLRMPVDDIVVGCQARHVIITGGEPTIWNLQPLTERLRVAGKRIQLETSGLKGVGGALFDHITWSPKERLGFICHDSIANLCKEVKWVVDDGLTLETIMKEWNRMMYLPHRQEMPIFVLMPEGSPPSAAHIGKCLTMLKQVPHPYQHHFRYGDRLQYALGMR